jgi:hypothetical protein
MELIIGFLLGLIAHDTGKKILLSVWTKDYDKKI